MSIDDFLNREKPKQSVTSTPAFASDDYQPENSGVDNFLNRTSPASTNLVQDVVDNSKESSQGYNALADMMGFFPNLGRGIASGTLRLGKIPGDIGQAFLDSQAFGPVPEVIPGPVDEYINKAFNKYAPAWIKSGFYNKLWKAQEYAELVSKTWEDLSQKMLDPKVANSKWNEAPFSRAGMVVGSSIPLMVGAAAATMATSGTALPEIVIGNVGPAVFGTQAFGEGYTKAKENGLDNEEALTYGVLNGAWTMATEKIPFEAMLSAKSKPLLKRLATGGTAEAGQELFQQVGQNLIEATQGDEIAYNQIFNGWLDALVGGAFAGFVGGGMVHNTEAKASIPKPEPKVDISGYDSKVDSFIESIKTQNTTKQSILEQADAFGTLMKSFFRKIPKDLQADRFINLEEPFAKEGKGGVSLAQKQDVLSNEKGEPITFYHGTQAAENFKDFKPQGTSLQPEAIFFSENPKLANIASTGFKSASDTRRARVAPVYLKAKNVFDYRNFDEASLRSFLEEKLKRGDNGIDFPSVLEHTIESVKAGNYAAIESPVIHEWIKQQGFDAFRMQEGGNETIGVYSNDQVVPKFDTEGIGLYQDKKGQISFLKNGQALFKLFESADMSTLLHEGTHFFSMFLNDSQVEQVAKWAGVDSKALLQFVTNPFKTSPQQRADAEVAMEKLADASEKYFRTGKAPSSQLQAIFDKFREWMVAIYKTLKGTKLDVNIPAEIEKIFSDWFVSQSERQQDYGEIHNERTGMQFPIYLRKGGKQVPVFDQKNQFTGWVGVDNLIRGEPPTESQLKLLGQGAVWKSPIDLSIPKSENPQIAIEQLLTDLGKMSAFELQQVAEKYGVSLPKDASRGDRLYAIESALRDAQTLSLPDQPFFGHQKMSAAFNSMVTPDKSNIIYRGGKNVLRGVQKYIYNYWTQWMSDAVGAKGGEVGQQLKQIGLKHADTVHKLYGAFIDDAEDYFKLLNPKTSQQKRDINDLTRFRKDGKSLFSKFSMALNGEEVSLTEYQKQIINQYKKIYSMIGNLAETGKVGKSQLLKGGIRVFDEKLESVDLNTGKKTKGDYRGFKKQAEGGINRFTSSHFQDILTSKDPKLRIRLARELGRLNNLDTNAEKALRKALTILTRTGKSLIEKKSGLENLRSLKVIPDSIEEIIDGMPKRVDLLHTDPYDSMMQMLHSQLSRLAAIDALHSFDESSKLYNNNEEGVVQKWQEAYEKEAPHEGWRSDNLLRAMNGLPVFPNDQLKVGSLSWKLDEAIKTMLVLYKGLRLPMSFVSNIPETMGLLQGMVGPERVKDAWKTLFSENRSDAIRMLSRMGGRSILASKSYINPISQYRDISRLAAGILTKGIRTQSELNEIIAGIAFNEMVMDMRGRVNLETGEIERNPNSADRVALLELGFSKSQVEKLLTGKASDNLYNAVVTRGVAKSQATNRFAGEQTPYFQSQWYKKFVQFDTYSANITGRLINQVAMVVNKEPGAAKLLARTVAGITGSGALSSILTGMIYGGFEDLKEKGKRVSNPLGALQFLGEAFLANLSGPLYAYSVAVKNRDDLTGLNTLVGATPFGLALWDTINAIKGTGPHYKDMSLLDRTVDWMKAQTPLSKVAHSLMAAMGIGGRSLERDAAIKAYWRWYRKSDIPRTSGQGSKENEEIQDKKFRMWMKKASHELDNRGLGAKGSGDNVYKYLQNAVQTDLTDVNRVIQSLERRKFLDLDVYGMSHKPNMTPERLTKLQKSMTKEHFEQLKLHDQMIELLQERLRNEY